MNALYKQVSLALSRQARHQGAGGHDRGEGDDGAEEEEEEERWLSSIDGLPLEVQRVVLSHLDPPALVAMACASRSWRALAWDDDFWRPWTDCMRVPHAAATPDLGGNPNASYHAFRDRVNGQCFLHPLQTMIL